MNTSRRLAAQGAGSPGIPASITHFLALHILALQILESTAKRRESRAGRPAMTLVREPPSGPAAGFHRRWRLCRAVLRAGWAGSASRARAGARPSRRNGLAGDPAGAVRSLGSGAGRPCPRVRSCTVSCCLTAGYAPCAMIDAAGAKIPGSASNGGRHQTCSFRQQQEPVGGQIAVGPPEPSRFSCPGRTKPQSVTGRVPALAPRQIESQLAGA